MKIKRAVIVSIVLTIVLIVFGRIPKDWNMLIVEDILSYLCVLSHFWIVYEIIAQIVRSIYKAIKSRKNPQPQTPPEP